MNQGFDLTSLFSQMLSTVPLWVLIAFAYRAYANRQTERNDLLEKRFEELKQMNIQQALEIKSMSQTLALRLSDMHEKMNAMELRLATEGVHDVKGKIEALQKSEIQHEMKISAAFSFIDILKEERSKAKNRRSP